MAKTLTDAQVVQKAWGLIRTTNIKEHLPVRYTIQQLMAASDRLSDLGIRFLEKYGKRLKALDSSAWTELNSWKQQASSTTTKL